MTRVPPSPLERRSFLQRAAVGAAALLAGGWTPARAESTRGTGAASDGDAWLDRITGKHRQVFDCTSPNGGFGAAFGLNLVDSYATAHVPARDVSVVVSYRHSAMPLMLNDAMWAKYHVGELVGVTDPATKEPATRNLFRDRIPGHPDLTYESAIAQHGLIMTACGMALAALSGMAAAKAKLAAAEVKAEWTENLLPGVVLVPSGVYAVNRAQERGCTYCAGG